jgi:DNA-binding CsgD family transcriptional regulator
MVKPEHLGRTTKNDPSAKTEEDGSGVLTEQDFRDLVCLLNEVSDPSETEILKRRTLLAKGLADLVGSDIYIWSIGLVDPTHPGERMPTMFLDGGWNDDAQRDAFYRLAVDSNAGRAVQPALAEHIHHGRSVTMLLSDLVSQENWEPVRGEYEATGCSDTIMSARCIGKNAVSCLGLHRKLGRPRFTARDRLLVHIVFQNIDWIHDSGLNVSAGEVALKLTYRQREILLLLLRGKSRKSIAASLGLSEHTVVAYMREIYRRFNSRSRSELMSRFITGGASE